MISNNKIQKIVITGPESTGKTSLSRQLSEYYNAPLIPEYARKYIETLNNKYNYNDVVNIAKYQIEQLEKINTDYSNSRFVFIDTGLIITKIWFNEVYKKIPDFLINSIKNIKIDLFYLCYPDIPWVPDKVRENGGKKRIELFYKYKYELDYYNFKYIIIKGDIKNRFLSAKIYISSAYCL